MDSAETRDTENRIVKIKRYLSKVSSFSLGESRKTSYAQEYSQKIVDQILVPNKFNILNWRDVSNANTIIEAMFDFIEKQQKKIRPFARDTYSSILKNLKRKLINRLDTYVTLSPNQSLAQTHADSIKSTFTDLFDDLYSRLLEIAPLSLRRLPLRSSITSSACPSLTTGRSPAGSCRSSCIDDTQRSKVFTQIQPAFGELGVSVTNSNLFLSETETLQYVRPLFATEEILYFDTIITFASIGFSHVIGSLYYRQNGTVVLLNGYYDSRLGSLRSMMYQALGVQKIYILPNDLRDRKDDFNIQAEDLSRFGEGQCQDWSFLLAYEFAKRFNSDSIPTPQFNLFLQLISTEEQQFIDNCVDFYTYMEKLSHDVSAIADLQRSVGLYGGNKDVVRRTSRPRRRKSRVRTVKRSLR